MKIHKPTQSAPADAVLKERETTMIYRSPRPRQIGATGTVLRRLLESTLIKQLLPCGAEPDVRTVDGYATVWLPDAHLAITSLEASSPISALERSRAAETIGIDILAMDLSRPGDIIECEIDLFSSRHTQQFSADRLALWLSPTGVASLVAYKPRNDFVVLPPCFAIKAAGITLMDDPFANDEEWIAGVERATRAASGVPVQARAFAPAVK